jgi:hypothetical protein
LPDKKNSARPKIHGKSMVFLLKEADTNRRKLSRLVVFLEISSMQPVEIYGI